MAEICTRTLVVTLHAALVALYRASRIFHAKIRKIAALSKILTVFADGDGGKTCRV